MHQLQFTLFPLAVFAYLLGSVSSAVIFCRLAGLPDPRSQGSKNAGATNVLRLGGKLAALGVLSFDLLKGVAPVWLGVWLGLNPFEVGMVGLAVCIGHVYPCFFGFRGGKAVATALGVLIALHSSIAGAALLSWLVVFLLFGYASLSAVFAALIVPLYAWYFLPSSTFPVALICCLLVYRHHDNIQRIWRHQEPRVFTLWRRQARD